MDQWVQNPKAHTALDDILPCVDNATATETLSQTKLVTYQLVEIVDNFMNTIANKNFPPQARPLYYNQSGPLMPLLCNPFNADLSDHLCKPGEVHLSNATEVNTNLKQNMSVIFFFCFIIFLMIWCFYAGVEELHLRIYNNGNM